MENKSVVVGIIPARAGSQRIPNKNFRNFAGKPLLVHTLEQALSAEKLDFLYVSTNNDNFISELPTEFKSYFIRRPDELCNSQARGYTYIRHALEIHESNIGLKATHFVSLPPTSPLKTSEDIDRAIELLLGNPETDSVTSMVPVNQVYHCFKQKKVNGSGYLEAYCEEENGRSTYNQLPALYVRNCAIYASKVSVLENKSMIGERCIPYHMPVKYAVDINEMIDFEIAEFLFKKYLQS